MEDKHPTWKCSNCGYTFEAREAPDKCSACNAECSFLNVTCYTPDCAGGAVDERLG